MAPDPLSALTLLSSNFLYRIEFAAQMHKATLDSAAIGFKLRFTRPSSADATTELRHRFAAPRQAGKHVFKLRQLYL